jgi:Na+/H+ antiporter NhaC
MKKVIIIFLLIFIISSINLNSENNSFKIPSVVFKGKVLNIEEIGKFDKIFLDGKEIKNKKIIFYKTGNFEIKIIKDKKEFIFKVFSIYGILTILPPLIAILLALIFKETIIALFIGVLTGAFIVGKFDFIGAFFNVVDKYIIEAIANKKNASIIIFTLLLGGMVGIITKSGGVKGIVKSLSNRVRSSRSTQLYTWLMGILIFFDDYTNTLVVGNTMRPLTDKWKISREKLSYIVDSTAAPVASIAVISTWIGFEISLIDQSLKAYNVNADAYELLLSSLPYRFYSILALIFVFLIFFMRRDFGPMLKAERRAATGKVLRDKAVPISDFESSGLNPSKYIEARWYNALIPIVVVIVFTFGGLYISGKNHLLSIGNPIANYSFFEIVFVGDFIRNVGKIVSSADSFKVLLWASMMGAVTAFFLSYFQKILKIKDLISSFIQGMKSMIMAIVILVLAWSLGIVLVQLGTADFLVSLLHSNLDFRLFPAIVFIFSAFIAFSTGTSWGTIAIMFPLVIPMVIVMLKGSPEFRHFLILSISSVLAGSVFGDHCSPISDTTIMSSLASSCDHIDHVKTQFPYSLTVALIALFFGIIPVSLGFPYLLSMLISVSLALIVILFFGKKVIE